MKLYISVPYGLLRSRRLLFRIRIEQGTPLNSPFPSQNLPSQQNIKRRVTQPLKQRIELPYAQRLVIDENLVREKLQNGEQQPCGTGKEAQQGHDPCEVPGIP